MRSEQRSAATRDSSTVEPILASAEQCFRDAGYAKVTLREIAEHAGVSKSLVLYHFESKDHVFAELQLRIYRRLAKSLTSALGSAGGSAANRARIALDRLIETVRDNDLIVHAMLGAHALANPEKSAHVRRMQRELRALLQSTMTEIFHDSQDRLPLSLDAIADLLWAALIGLGFSSVLDDSPEELERGFDSLRTIVTLAFGGTEAGA